MSRSRLIVVPVLLLASLPLAVSADDEPAVFLPGIVSSAAIEDAADLSPDGELLVFARRDGHWGGASGPGTLYASRRIAVHWQAPVPLPFSGAHDDGDPSFSPDGRFLYFTSTRPVAGVTRADQDLWVAARDGNTWGAPRHLGDAVNSPAQEYSPSVTADGTLYFVSMRAGGLGQGDLYSAAPGPGGFMTPQNLGATLNTAAGEWNVTVAPDESFLVFEASGRPTNRSVSGDLYVSYRRGSAWSAAVALAPVNTTESELNARFRGGQFLFARSKTAADGSREADILAMPAASVLPHRADLDRPRVVAVSRSRHEIHVIETGSWRGLFRHAVGSGPHEVALAPDGRHAYTADYGQFPEPHDAPIEPGPIRWHEQASGTITAIDLAGGAARRIAVPGCSRNHGILASRDGRLLWTTCEAEGAVLEIDIGSGERRGAWGTAVGSHQLAATTDENLLIASNVESGSVSLIRRDTGTVTTIATGAGAEGLALSPDGRRLWVGNGTAGTVSIVDTTLARVVETIPSGGRFPVKLAFTPDGSEVWVVNTASRSIAVFDAATHRQLQNHDFDSPPLGILAAPDGAAMLVTFPRRNELAVLSRANGERLATVSGIVEADGLAWIPVAAQPTGTP